MSLAWTIEISDTAKKQLKKMGKEDAKRIISYLKSRAAEGDNPRKTGKALKGNLSELWRYRIGDFRVICELQDNVMTILVLKAGHRKEIYKRH